MFEITCPTSLSFSFQFCQVLAPIFIECASTCGIWYTLHIHSEDTQPFDVDGVFRDVYIQNTRTRIVGHGILRLRHVFFMFLQRQHGRHALSAKLTWWIFQPHTCSLCKFVTSFDCGTSSGRWEDGRNATDASHFDTDQTHRTFPSLMTK